MGSYKVDSDHEGYDDIHNAWVTNGRPGQFDIFFSDDIAGLGAGSALIIVLDRTVTYPDFYIKYSAQGTTFNEDSAAENPTHRGMLCWNLDYWNMRGYSPEDGIDTGDWRIVKPKQPPNELVEGE
jgi:hypothetical protein